MSHVVRNFPVMLLCLTLSLSVFAAEPPQQSQQFPLRDGDLWVMAGDSITAQHLHSNYFEAFCYARYPQWKFAFRNSGVGGHTIPSTLARFDYDVAAWKPTVVSVELGMNDAGRYSSEDFMKNMQTWIDRVRSIGARPVLFAPSPVNDGTLLAQIPAGNRNQRLHEYSSALQDFAKKNHLPYADQFHDLLDVWGKNKPHELAADLIPAVRPVAAQNSVVGSEHLQAFLKAQDALPEKPVSLGGNPVHPGPAGQLMMAASLLKGLGAKGFVSSLTIQADGSRPESKGCQVSSIQHKAGGLSFERLDECLPFPIPDAAAAVLTLTPAVYELSQYTLAVQGLKSGRYSLKINDVPVAELTSEQFSQGVNLTAYGPGMKRGVNNPVEVQGKAILDAVTAKEALVSQWRVMSKSAQAAGAPADIQEQLTKLNEKIEAADAAIRVAAQPQRLRFSITVIP